MSLPFSKFAARAVAGLLLLSTLTSCGGTAATTPTPSAAPAEPPSPEAQAELDAQLGLLSKHITEEERQAAMDLWLQIRPIREARLAAGQWAYRPREESLLQKLSDLYDQYTIKYLDGDAAGFGYTNPEETTLISYNISEDGTLIADPDTAGQLEGWTEEELMLLWRDMTELLPEGAFADFKRLTFFTDGPEETVAWVCAMRWETAYLRTRQRGRSSTSGRQREDTPALSATWGFATYMASVWSGARPRRWYGWSGRRRRNFPVPLTCWGTALPTA